MNFLFYRLRRLHSVEIVMCGHQKNPGFQNIPTFSVKESMHFVMNQVLHHPIQLLSIARRICTLFGLTAREFAMRNTRSEISERFDKSGHDVGRRDKNDGEIFVRHCRTETLEDAPTSRDPCLISIVFHTTVRYGRGSKHEEDITSPNKRRH